MPAGKQNEENREEPMKYKIEKNTVQETLILPLYSRKLCKIGRASCRERV